MQILATLCYIKDGSRTLMLHRVKRKNDIHEGKWNGLGGKFEAGESPEACVTREIKEECGLTIRNPELRGFLTFPEFARGDDWYVFVFVARDFDGELTETEEGHLEWIDDDRLLDLNLWGGDRYFLEHLESGRFFSGTFTYRGGELVDHELVLYQAQLPAQDF